MGVHFSNATRWKPPRQFFAYARSWEVLEKIPPRGITEWDSNLIFDSLIIESGRLICPDLNSHAQFHTHVGIEKRTKIGSKCSFFEAKVMAKSAKDQD
jgi:hypothetical protein